MTSQLPDAIRQQLADLARELDDHSHGRIASEVLSILVAISQSNADSGDWELIKSTLADMAEALDVFQPHRQIRKVAISVQHGRPKMILYTPWPWTSLPKRWPAALR